MRLTYQVSVIVALCLFALVLGLGVISFFGPAGAQSASAGQPTASPTGAAVSEVGGANGVTLKVYAASPVPSAVTLPTVAPTDAPQVAAAPAQATVIVTMIVEATAVPTVAPTNAPTVAATAVPTSAPTNAATTAPTSAPTVAATKAATAAPTAAATKAAATAVKGAGQSAPTAAALAPKRMPVTADSDETISSVVWIGLIAALVLVVVVGGLSFRTYGNVLGFADTVAAQLRAVREAARKSE